MQVIAEQTDPCTIVLDIAVDEQQVARAFDRSYREFARYANIPGFRPGKAPRAIVERFVDAERVRRHTLEKLIEDSIPQALEEQGIVPFRAPQVEPTDIEDKKPYSYKATVPLEPQITLGTYTGLTVERPVLVITDTTVEERIQKLREDRARLDRITDRGVQEGDVLIAESQAILEGEEATEEPHRQLIQVGANIPGFDAAIMGMTAGEERSFELTYPDDFQEEAKRGKKATFTVKLSSISAKRLPELDADFAKQVADVDSVEALRERVRERLEAEAEHYGNEIAEHRLIEQIITGSEIHYPEVLVREDLEEKLRTLGNELQYNKVTYEQYLAQMGATAEQHQAALYEQSEVQTRSVLALRLIAAQEGLQPSEEEVDAEFDRLFAAGRIDESQYENYLQDPRRRLQVASALTQQRLHDFLFANNTLVPVEQTEPLEAEEAAEVSAAAGAPE